PFAAPRCLRPQTTRPGSGPASCTRRSARRLLLAGSVHLLLGHLLHAQRFCPQCLVAGFVDRTAAWALVPRHQAIAVPAHAGAAALFRRHRLAVEVGEVHRTATALVEYRLDAHVAHDAALVERIPADRRGVGGVGAFDLAHAADRGLELLEHLLGFLAR